MFLCREFIVYSPITSSANLLRFVLEAEASVLNFKQESKIATSQPSSQQHHSNEDTILALAGQFR